MYLLQVLYSGYYYKTRFCSTLTSSSRLLCIINKCLHALQVFVKSDYKAYGAIFDRLEQVIPAIKKVNTKASNGCI